jgi:UDP-N-acetylglucosamine 2-epimerase (non-hydrolysing)
MRVIAVAGARPNFMKIKPVVDELERRGLETILVHTGQHYDDEMSAVFFEDLGLREPDHHLGVGAGSHAEQTGRVMGALEPLVADTRPDVLVVVGDVNSTLGGALVGAKAGARVAHVEAGLRSGDWRMPEEINRVVADRVSHYLFATSSGAVENLRAEGFDEDQIHLVGNVMIDTLLSNLERARDSDIHERLGLGTDPYALVTLHRPENADDPRVLTALSGAFARISERVPIVFPAHPRVRERLDLERLGPRVKVVAPAGYLDFIALESAAALVLTDSGGIQEETTVLGVACLTLRDSTERPITIDEGTNRLVGKDPERIVAGAFEVLERGVEARAPALWDGKAAHRIAEVIASGYVPSRFRAPEPV